MTTLALMAATLIALLLLGFPIALVLGATGLIWVMLLDPFLLRGAAHTVVNTVTSETLISVPLFILMGHIVERSDVAGKFYNAIALWMRRLPGGLLHANIAVCAVFSSVSGSSVATAATVGTTAIPNLMRLKYDVKIATGSLAAGGTLGILIPPSIPLIIYGALVQESTGQLFVAAVVPGLMMVAIFTAYILLRGIMDPAIAPPVAAVAPTARERLVSLWHMAPLLLITVVVFSGIYFGWTTATEAAALGLFMALVMAALEGKLTFAMLRKGVSDTTVTTAMLLFIVVGAQLFSFAVFSWGLNSKVATLVGDLPYPRLVIFGVIVAIYLVLGMFIDALSMMLMTLAVVHPVIVKLGYDPIWFGIVLVLLLEIGLITPPVGMNLFTIQAISEPKVKLGDVAAGALPFAVLMLIGIGLLIAFPGIVMWLPSQAF